MNVRDLIALLEQEDPEKDVQVLHEDNLFDVRSIDIAQIQSPYDQDFDYSVVVIKT